MCPACWRGSTAAGPDGVRDPNPNTNAALKACAPNGFSGSSVRPIVISFSSFPPASTRVLAVLDDCRPAVARVIATHAVWGHPVVQSRPKPRGGSIAGSSPRSSSHIALQHVGYSAVAQVRRQGCQPSGILGLKAYECADGVVPALGAAAMVGWTTDADRRSASRACRRAVAGHGVRHPSWASRRLIDGAWVPLRSDTSRNGVRRIRRRPADAG